MSIKTFIHRWSDESAIEQSGAQYAGLWRRVASAFIDSLVFLPPYLVCLWLLPYWMANALFTIFGLLVFTWSFSSWWQGSPGMRIMKIYVVSTSNRRLSLEHALVWSITSFGSIMLCFAAMFYLETIVDVEAISKLVLTEPDFLPNLQQGIIDPRLTEALRGISFEEYRRLSNMVTLITCVMFFFWALSIAIPHNKAGFHNWLCKTRFLKGKIVKLDG